MKAIYSFETSGTDYPVGRDNDPEKWLPKYRLHKYKYVTCAVEIRKLYSESVQDWLSSDIMNKK